MSNEIMKYPDVVPQLLSDLEDTREGDAKNLAQRLIDGGVAMDLAKLGLPKKIPGQADMQRDRMDPIHYEDDSVNGHVWADDSKNPLKSGEKWNSGRRQSHRLTYTFNNAGIPVNPYIKTGLSGRGILGRFGPNHAVDIGAFRVMPDCSGDLALHILAINRKDADDKPAFCGGFVEFHNPVNGEYVLDDQVILETKAYEFFEEMVSGSITLLPEFQARLEEEHARAVEALQKRRGGAPVSEARSQEMFFQIEAGLKIEQVQTYDPEFFDRLMDVLSDGHDVYAGPILQSSRNTDNAWLETHLAWIELDEAEWEYVRGDPDPVFDYEFSAGDDASDVGFFKLGPELLEEIIACHGAMLAFMTASYLLDKAHMGEELPDSVWQQMERMADHLERYHSNKPGICPQGYELAF